MTDAGCITRSALIVDDDELVRLSTRAQLEDLGWAVHEGADALAGVTCLLEHPDVGFVLLDLRLPDTDPLDTLQRLRAARAEVPVLVFSGLGRWHAPAELLSAVGVGFLAKPFTMEELAAGLAAVGVVL